MYLEFRFWTLKAALLLFYTADIYIQEHSQTGNNVINNHLTFWFLPLSL